MVFMAILCHSNVFYRATVFLFVHLSDFRGAQQDQNNDHLTVYVNLIINRFREEQLN